MDDPFQTPQSPNDNRDPEKKPEYPITAGEITRVILATLLILVAGFVLVALLVFSGVLTGGKPLTQETLDAWTSEGLTSLPTSIKVAAMVVQFGFIIPAWIFLRRKSLSRRTYFRIQPVPITMLFYSVLIGLGVALIGDELNRLVALLMPVPEAMFEGVEQTLSMKTMADYLTMGLTVVLIAPIIEEMLFRGFFQRYFEATRGVTAGVLTTSALFAAYHFNLYWLIPILVMATIMGAMAWRAESVLPSIAVHATNNFIGLLAANTWGSQDPEWYAANGHLKPLILLVALGALVLGLRLFFAQAQEKGLGGHGPGGDSGHHIDTEV